MAKKLITPEEYKSKMDKKVEKRKRFAAPAPATQYSPIQTMLIQTATVRARTPHPAEMKLKPPAMTRPTMAKKKIKAAQAR